MLKPLLLATSFLGFAAQADPIPSFDFGIGELPDTGAIAIIAGDDGELNGPAASLDAAFDGRLSEALDMHNFEGDFGEVVTFNGFAPYSSIVVIGAGSEALTAPKLHDLAGNAAQITNGDVTVITDNVNAASIDGVGAHIAAGFALGRYAFTQYQRGSKEDASPANITILSPDAEVSNDVYNGDLRYLVEGTWLARDLGSEPGNTIYPQSFVDRVRGEFRGVSNVRIEVLDAAAIRREGMGALMGVGQGSIHDPRLLVVRYNGGSSGDAPLALVGKGVTFDTGGISIKPNAGMWLMKSDLSGAAAVAGAVLAAAKRGEEINLVGLMPLAENMPSQDAIRPGDVLTTMGGKTIEIMSTDAEGRLLLADAVQYAQEKYDPYMLLNIATLTGSAARALDDDYGAVITRDLDLSLDMVEIGETAGEPVWPLPLHPSHFDQIRSDIADIKSTAGSPGASIGAAVVGTFVDENLPWVHLDIAGVDWMTRDKPTIPAGHAGWGVRFMDGLVRCEAE